MTSRAQWIKTPDELAKAYAQYADRVVVAVKALADYLAQKMQGEMREGAPWTDRTGNARSGLFSVTEQASKELVNIYLSHGHTIYYGLWLETARGGKYAIIEPTIQRNLPVLKKMLDELFK